MLVSGGDKGRLGLEREVLYLALTMENIGDMNGTREVHDIFGCARALAIASLSAAFLAGCDADLLGERREEREQEEQELERKDELANQRDLMTNYATGKRDLFEARLADVTREGDSLRADLKTLSSVFDGAMAERDADGKARKYEVKVLRVMKNEDVNALAAKYLASDFTGTTAAFIERVREARAAEAKYAEAVRGVDEIYEANVAETRKWAQMSQRQKDAEVVRLRKEIASLEAKRRQLLKESKQVTRHSILGGSRQEDERFEARTTVLRRVEDLDKQISTKRRQCDYLSDPGRQDRLARDATDAAQTKQRYAMSTKESAMRDIDKRLKPKKSLTDIVAEFEAESIGKLRKVLSEKISAADGEAQKLKAKIALADEILLSIPLSDLSELRRQKAQLDK